MQKRLPKKTSVKANPSKIEIIEDQLRVMSGWTVLFHESIAKRLGLNVTDHKCLDLILRGGALPAGELARRSGLTTGAITGVIDRLEKAGLAKRVADPKDRRRVLVELQEENVIKVVVPLFNKISRDTRAMLGAYQDNELKVIQKFLVDCIDVTRSQLEMKPSRP